MQLLFWASVLAVAYVYAGYPLLLTLWARARRRSTPLAGVVTGGAACPGVTVVVVAHNEAERLVGRIDNLLAQEYPADRRQIIVVSDGSTDDTAARVGRYGAAVEFVAVPRGGKALALNAGVARAAHDLLVFADARQRFAPDALRQLVAPFADPSIGGVTGELVLDVETACRRRQADRRTAARPGDAERRRTARSTIADGVGFYWQYEKHLRRLESAIASTLGATGCIYALRRSLWKPLPADTILDDVLVPMRAVLAGARVVFAERARAFDRAADAAAESRRKVRTLAGNVQILWLEPRLLIPIVNPVWLQYLSHKVGRLVVPYALLTLFASSLALAETHPVYATALAGQCALYLLGGAGAWLEWRDRAAARPAAQPAAAWRPAAVTRGKGAISASAQ
jgi:cellulose synthase/poly-beta-1,6-N-acetylglucosamine synthase-like glycosyltransferase